MPTTSNLRYREQGNAESVFVTNKSFSCNGSVVSTSNLNAHMAGEVVGCVDYVTPSFYKRSRSGEIINNTFFKVTQTFEGGGTGNATRSNPCPSPYGFSGTDWDASQRHFNNRFRFKIWRVDGQLAMIPLNVDIASYIRDAKTKALASVDNSTAEGLVSLAELRQTLRMLRNPLESLRTLTERWGKQKHLDKAVLQTLTNGPSAIANQYLAYYYGMRPLASDMENLMKAYLTEGQNPERRTARGSSKYTNSEVTVEGGAAGVPVGKSWYQNQFTRTENVTIRSGILYEPSLDDYAKTMGFRISDVPSAIWEATPWSFFWDYFGNFGTLVQALSPRIGVKYLASWTTVESEVILEARTIASGVIPGGSAYQTRQGTEWSRASFKAKLRTPDSPYDNIGLKFRFDPESWALAKQLAVSCLAIQRVHATWGSALNKASTDWLYKNRTEMNARRKAKR